MTITSMQRKHMISYRYNFRINSRRYQGTCTGCTTLEEAKAFEKETRLDIEKAKNVNSPSEALMRIITEHTKADEKTALRTVATTLEQLNTVDAVTLDDAFEKYLKKPSRYHAAEAQIERNRAHFKDFVEFMHTKYPKIVYLRDVNRTHAEAYIMQLRTNGVFNPERVRAYKRKTVVYVNKCLMLSNTTINKYHETIKSVFTRLAEDENIQYNPFNIPTLPKNDTVSRDVFSMEEIDLIVANVTMPYTKPLVIVGLFTGLTMGDICQLKWSEIQNRMIKTKRNKTGVPLEIPILQPVQRLLDEVKDAKDGTDYVFKELAQNYNKNQHGVCKIMRRFLERSGINTQSDQGTQKSRSIKGAHAFRHTFAYLAGLYEIPFPIVQSILGHMTPRMTALYQSHATRQDKLEQMQRFMAAFDIDKDKEVK